MSDIPSSMHLVKKGEFFGVYILLCKGPENVGAVYIGFTVNPPRRIRQHNREIKGGAWKTKRNKGNWYVWNYLLLLTVCSVSVCSWDTFTT